MHGTTMFGNAMQAPGALLAGLPGGWEWIVILVIFLLLFGRRLPGVARSLGQGISSFKKGLNEPVEQDDGDDEPKASAKRREEISARSDDE